MRPAHSLAMAAAEGREMPGDPPQGPPLDVEGLYRSARCKHCDKPDLRLPVEGGDVVGDQAQGPVLDGAGGALATVLTSLLAIDERLDGRVALHPAVDEQRAVTV